MQTSRYNTYFRFQFYGTFISVVGVSPVRHCQSTWTIDGQNHTIQHLGNVEVNTYFEWLSMNFAFPGDHTLEFTGSGGELFTLDYIMYTPSKSTLETQPNGANVPGSTRLSPTVVPTKVSTTTQRLSKAEITSVVIGATAGLAATLLVLILLIRVKRRTKEAKKQSIEQVNPYPITELPPSDMIKHKSSIPGASVDQAREDSIEVHYVLPNSSDGVEHRSTFQRILGAITRRNSLVHVEPFRSISYRVRQSDLMAHHKPSVPDIHSVPTIEQRIPVIEEQDIEENADDATSMTATVVAQEGDTRSRVEHLWRLMAEIQRELAESGSVTSRNN
ncbi:hypothetical protein DXG01_000665 [Tephrocybe rancida]|nr:hypothetical protein DXG01_000665 [Tephrocybe rancida]